MTTTKSIVYITYAVFVDGEWKLENMKREFGGYGGFVSVDCNILIQQDIAEKFKKECRYVLVDKCMATTYEEK